MLRVLESFCPAASGGWQAGGSWGFPSPIDIIERLQKVVEAYTVVNADLPDAPRIGVVGADAESLQHNSGAGNSSQQAGYSRIWIEIHRSASILIVSVMDFPMEYVSSLGPLSPSVPLLTRDKRHCFSERRA